MSSQRPQISLRRITRRASLGLLGVGIPSGLWGFAVEPDLLSITRREITLPRWPTALDGFRLAQITDVHYRPGKDEALVEKLKAAVSAEAPDLIAVTGDFVIDDPSSLPEFAKAFQGITAPHGVFASPGNHDRWHCTPAQLKKESTRAGMNYLQNAGSQITIKGESFFLSGLDSVWAGHPNPALAWQGAPIGAPVISLVHEPDFFSDLAGRYPLDLQLSGHTHGGQCRVPLLGYAPVKVPYGRDFIYGSYQQQEAQLFVGRGIGTVGPRVRFACRPELVILTLRSV